jgi:hypothetical protein
LSTKQSVISQYGVINAYELVMFSSHNQTQPSLDVYSWPRLVGSCGAVGEVDVNSRKGKIADRKKRFSFKTVSENPGRALGQIIDDR